MSSDGEQVLKCQNCRLPLEIDSSLLDLSLPQQSLLINSAGNYVPPKPKIPIERLERLQKVQEIDDIKLSSQYSIIPDSLAYHRDENNQNVSDSNTLQNDDDNENNDTEGKQNLMGGDKKTADSGLNKTLSTQIVAISNIFNILSNKSKIDYPVCQDCCNLLIQKLKSEYDDALKERDTYSGFLTKLDKQHKQQQQQHAKLQATNSNNSITNSPNEDDTVKLENEKTALVNKLKKLEAEEDQLDLEIESLEQQLKDKRKLEQDDLRRQNLNDLAQIEFNYELQNLKNQYEIALNDLDSLRKINVYNETFKISHDGPFGTINGLKLGGLDGSIASWNEINAAIGQIILLLSTISTRLKCKLKGYRLQPMGSYSKITKYDEETQDWVSYEVYNDSNFKISKLFRKETNLDKALEYLLDIIQQLADLVIQNSNVSDDAEESTSFVQELPYFMSNGKINNISVKLFGGEPNLKWTTAMKFLLTNVKWLLVFSSSRLINSRHITDGNVV